MAFNKTTKYVVIIKQNDIVLNCKDCNSYKEAMQYVKSVLDSSKGITWVVHRVAQSFVKLPAMKKDGRLVEDKEKTRERIDKIYTIEEVHALFDKWEEEFGPMIKRQHDRISTEYDGYPVKTFSQRYEVFRNNTKCVVCGLEATHYRLERQIGAKNYHFNLYAIKNGEEVLFTKDHILPASKGGKNTLDNYQTMCQFCNQEKADAIEISTGVYKEETRTCTFNTKAEMEKRKDITHLIDPSGDHNVAYMLSF